MQRSHPTADTASPRDVGRIPPTMSAAVYRRFGPPEVVQIENVPNAEARCQTRSSSGWWRAP